MRLTRVADHLRAEGGLSHAQAPTARQFDQTTQAIGLEMRSSRVVRAFGSWRNAKAALLGEHVLETPAQRRLRRHASTRARTHEDHITALRLWLATKPPALRRADYDAFAHAENQAQQHGSPLPRSSAIVSGLGIAWDEALRVAKGDTSLDAVHRSEGEELKGRDDQDLVGTAAVRALLGVRTQQVDELLRDPDFPVPVARLGRARVWVLGDLRAYRAGKPVPDRAEGELQRKLVGTTEMAELAGIDIDYLRTLISKQRWHLIPRPAGQVGAKHYWWRGEVKKWLAEHRRKRAATSECGDPHPGGIS